MEYYFILHSHTHAHMFNVNVTLSEINRASLEQFVISGNGIYTQHWYFTCDNQSSAFRLDRRIYREHFASSVNPIASRKLIWLLDTSSLYFHDASI